MFCQLSVPKYRSPNSPNPGITRKSSFSATSISEVTIFTEGNLLQTQWIPSGACTRKSKQNLIRIIATRPMTTKNNRKLTEMRLRKIIQLSGTPFCMRSSIAWLAELPKQIKGMTHQCACWQKGAVWTKDETVHIIERTVRHNLNLHIFLTKEKPQEWAKMIEFKLPNNLRFDLSKCHFLLFTVNGELDVTSYQSFANKVSQVKQSSFVLKPNQISNGR